MLTIKDLCFTYPGGVCALDGVSLTVVQGSFVTLCGASGCGKSTLLRSMKPTVTPHGDISGERFFMGKDLSAMSPFEQAQSIGYVAQRPEEQIVTDRVWHELAFGLESIGLPQEQMRRSVAEVAEYFGLEELFRKSTDTLSGGEKQLVTLAGTAALHPQLLLLDEPTSQLDPISAQGFIDMAVRLNRDFGVTVVIAEHRLEELLPVSDRVLVLDKGRIIADCIPEMLAECLPEAHPMHRALPAATRIFSLAGGSGASPLTVKQGRAQNICREYLKENAPRSTCIDRNSNPVLSARELWIGYNGEDVLKCADIELFSGEVFALLGGNGSGKTTLLKALSGMLKPMGGRVRNPQKKKIAFLPQDPCSLFTEDTVGENFRVGGADETKAHSVSQRLGLDETLWERDPLDLSGGERQRVGLAMLLSKEPDILLLDEPTKGMDALTKHELSVLLRELAQDGLAVLTVTHDVEFAAACADRCGLLFGGEIGGTGTPLEFFGGNYFYTTPLSRLAKGIADGWV